eukprot:COSAG01_NODE_3750_length_5733_cov_22.729322_2_plen_84_part_00
MSDGIQFHRLQPSLPRTAGTRWLVHQTHRCMLGMYLSWHAAASALRTKSDCSLQKNCSECVTAPPWHMIFDINIYDPTTPNAL